MGFIIMNYGQEIKIIWSKVLIRDESGIISLFFLNFTPLSDPSEAFQTHSKATQISKAFQTFSKAFQTPSKPLRPSKKPFRLVGDFSDPFRGFSHLFRGFSDLFRGFSDPFRGVSDPFRGLLDFLRPIKLPQRTLRALKLASPPKNSLRPLQRSFSLQT